MDAAQDELQTIANSKPFQLVDPASNLPDAMHGMDIMQSIMQFMGHGMQAGVQPPAEGVKHGFMHGSMHATGHA